MLVCSLEVLKDYKDLLNFDYTAGNHAVIIEMSMVRALRLNSNPGQTNVCHQLMGPTVTQDFTMARLCGYM